MKKLKIAFLSSGNLSHTIPYIEFFRGRGHEVYWITTDRSHRTLDVPVYDVSFGAFCKKTTSKWKYFLAGLAVRRTLKRLKPDILHGHYVTSAGVIAVMSGFHPYVMTVHGSDLIVSMNSVIWKRIVRYVFNHAALVNPVSDELYELTLQLGIHREKVLVATLGVDTRLFTFRPHLEIGSPCKLLCTRSLHPVFDPETIIKACKILKHHGFPFTMTFAASGPLQNSLIKMVSEKDLSDEITFLGGYESSALLDILHTHDFYISNSLRDGTSISLLEAMASGIFPIVSRINSNEILLEHGKTALMFACGNARELADKIMSAASSPSLRETAVVTNRRVVEERGDREKNMLILEKRFYEILGETLPLQ